ncbi:MAG: hypothetical protein MK213_06930 [Planctomycetes bacterium]|nr:hypothetical protein [Planctomycetota bacterium]
MVLHELSHAWHHQVLTYEHEGIREAYLDAVASTEWENVRYARGGTKRAYALNNPQEYFAEITEAYFGFNDFFPFVRGELLVFDPQGAELLAKVWAKVPEKTFIRPASGRRSSSINGR